MGVRSGMPTCMYMQRTALNMLGNQAYSYTDLSLFSQSLLWGLFSFVFSYVLEHFC